MSNFTRLVRTPLLRSRSPAQLVDRFLARKATGPVAGQASSPFVAHKNVETGRWAPPRYSARRQAALALTALREDRLDELPSSPKIDKLRARLAHALADPLPSAGISAAAQHAPKETKREVKARAMAHAQAMGPYKGRSLKKIFKGTVAERTAPAKQRAIQEKLQGMQGEIDEWRKVSGTTGAIDKLCVEKQDLRLSGGPVCCLASHACGATELRLRRAKAPTGQRAALYSRVPTRLMLSVRHTAMLRRSRGTTQCTACALAAAPGASRSWLCIARS